MELGGREGIALGIDSNCSGLPNLESFCDRCLLFPFPLGLTEAS